MSKKIDLFNSLSFNRVDFLPGKGYFIEWFNKQGY